jgi:hypothetical protein
MANAECLLSVRSLCHHVLSTGPLNSVFGGQTNRKGQIMGDAAVLGIVAVTCATLVALVVAYLGRRATLRGNKNGVEFKLQDADKSKDRS